MAEHIEFAVKRISFGDEISNPLTNDIRVLFHPEFKIAEKIRSVFKKEYRISISDDEIGYLAMHIERGMSEDQGSGRVIKVLTKEKHNVKI